MSQTQPAVAPRKLSEQFRHFLHLEMAGGVFLMTATVIALVLANSPLGESVDHFWHEHAIVQVGPIHIDESLAHWVNDALMAIFFFVAGLEIKRELVVGELRDPRRAALPAVAAAGGMIVPAAIYMLINAGGEGAGGWGIPLATDIAFAVAVLAMVGKGLPSGLKVFLLSLAIADDIGAVIVIALFYATVAGMWGVVATDLVQLVIATIGSSLRMRRETFFWRVVSWMLRPMVDGAPSSSSFDATTESPRSAASDTFTIFSRPLRSFLTTYFTFSPSSIMSLGGYNFRYTWDAFTPGSYRQMRQHWPMQPLVSRSSTAMHCPLPS